MARPLIVHLLALGSRLAAFASGASAASFGRDGTARSSTPRCPATWSTCHHARPGSTANPQLSRDRRAEHAVADVGPAVLRQPGDADVLAQRSGRGRRPRLRFVTVEGDDEIDASRDRRAGRRQPADRLRARRRATTRSPAARSTTTCAPAAAPTGSTGGPGADVLRGDEGDDVFVDLVGDDTIVGGAGRRPARPVGRRHGRRGGLAERRGRRRPARRGGERRRRERHAAPPTPTSSSAATAPNRIDGGDGNDVIDVRGGGIDTRRLRPGVADRVAADAEDVVDRLRDRRAAAPPVARRAVDDDGDGVLAGRRLRRRAAARPPGRPRHPRQPDRRGLLGRRRRRWSRSRRGSRSSGRRSATAPRRGRCACATCPRGGQGRRCAARAARPAASGAAPCG